MWQRCSCGHSKVHSNDPSVRQPAPVLSTGTERSSRQRHHLVVIIRSTKRQAQKLLSLLMRDHEATVPIDETSVEATVVCPFPPWPVRRSQQKLISRLVGKGFCESISCIGQCDAKWRNAAYIGSTVMYLAYTIMYNTLNSISIHREMLLYS